MGLADWIKGFRALHEKAKQGLLGSAEAAEYLRAREELARALLGAQRLSVPEGESARKMLRVARACQVTIDLASGSQKGMTVDLSQSGFGAIIGKPPDQGETVGLQLRLPGDPTPLVARAKTQGLKRQGGTYRVSFVFEPLLEADADRLGFAIFDTALSQLG